MTFVELNKLMKKTISELKAVGYRVGNIDRLRVSGRLRRAWANCARDTRHGCYTITFGRHTIERGCDEGIRGTMFHELIHTCEGCFNHGPAFKKAASIVNKAYGVRVSRTTSAEIMYNQEG